MPTLTQAVTDFEAQLNEAVTTFTTLNGVAGDSADIAIAQAQIAVEKAAEALVSWNTVQGIAASFGTVQAAIDGATAQAGIATTGAGTATTQAGISTVQAGLSATAKLQAEAARDLSQTYAAAGATAAKYYDTKALGRAAVADTFTFGVNAGGSDGLTRPTLFRRDSSTTQTEIVDQFRGSEFDALNSFSADGANASTDPDYFAARLWSSGGGLLTPAFEIKEGGGIQSGDLLLDVGAYDGLVVADPDYFGLLHANSTPDAAASASAVAIPAGPNYGGQLSALKVALTDVFYQFLGIVLPGDSITWGMTATGGAVSDPRTHALTDPRNNGTAPSWANLLHQYLGRDYYESTVVEAAWAGSPSGVCQFTYSRVVDVFPGLSPVTSTTNGVAWSTAANASSVCGVHWSSGSVALSAASLKFTMTGYGFTLVFAALGDGAAYQLVVNGVVTGPFYTDTATLGVGVSFGNLRVHTFASFKRDAAVEIRVVPSTAATTFRTESIRVNRQLRVTNQGIVGTNVEEYRAGLLPSAVREGDSFAFCQLGTNDRAIAATASVPKDLYPLYTKHRALLADMDALGLKTIVLCANAATPDTGMSLVRAALHQSARDARKDFIDQFALTRPTVGVAGNLADGLHPANPFHQLMFNNIYNRIEGL